MDNDDKAETFLDKHRDLPIIQPQKMMLGKISLVKDWNDMLRVCKDEEMITRSLTVFAENEKLPF